MAGYFVGDFVKGNVGVVLPVLSDGSDHCETTCRQTFSTFELPTNLLVVSHIESMRDSLSYDVAPAKSLKQLRGDS